MLRLTYSEKNAIMYTETKKTEIFLKNVKYPCRFSYIYSEGANQTHNLQRKEPT